MKLEIDDFEVGQIVFFIASKTESVIPALVAEKIVRTRIDGEKIGYILHIKTSKGVETAEVNPAKTKLYSDLEDVRTHMLKIATNAIDEIIAAAAMSAQEINGTVGKKKQPVELAGLEVAEVVLDDGRVAKIRMP